MTADNLDALREKLGLVHVYTGNGKGKTTAALGLAMRALEHGLNVSMVQFLKGGLYIGELLAPDRFSGKFSIEQFGKGSKDEPSYEDFSPDEADCERALRGLERAKALMAEGQTDVMILDEVNVALQLRHVSVAEVIELVKSKPANMELVLTGRYAPKEIMSIGDYVTEMKAHEHPYNKGILGRKGIDY
ncbi:cob(I)yrinic acid a,c-diamide adenosyltransferase [Candidatus Woesearchaeota archaeon]|nr:cob(I)yrinic acid a,c-diamide adenosyltransferase [Candidatus Woesearchaeota archaeon]